MADSDLNRGKFHPIKIGQIGSRRPAGGGKHGVATSAVASVEFVGRELSQARREESVMTSVAIRPEIDDSPLSLVGAARRIIEHRLLIGRLAWREIEAKYRGSFGGLLWALMSPLFTLAVYTFIFGTIFKSRWPDASPDAGTQEFALLIFFGLIIYGFMAECLSRAPMLIVSNPSYVKRVVSPLEILPVVTLLSALFHAGVSFAMLMAVYPFVFGAPPATALLTPIIIAPLCIGVLGVTWLFASLGVFIRDIGQIIPILLTAILFLSPIFYSSEGLPADFREALSYGPLVLILDSARAALFFGKTPDWGALAGYTVIATALATFGYWWFYRTRKAFADVI